MDRAIVYIGQVPQDTDILNTNLNAYIGLAKLSSTILGSLTQIKGLECVPTTPSPSMQVVINPGEIYQLANVDTTAYGSLPTNSNQILKQGINLNSTTLAALTAPGTVGFSINYLIEFALNEVDGGSQVLPYYNSANPTQAFSGPNNNSQPNFTVRQDTITIQVKAGTAAATGTQTTPTPDSGYVGAWVVTVANGQSSITSSSISLYSGAPYITPVFYAVDAGTANALAITTSATVKYYTPGLSFLIKVANTNTGASTLNVNSLGAVNIKHGDGTALIAGELVANSIVRVVYDGTQFQLSNIPNAPAIQNSSYISANDTGAVNAYVAALSPALTAYANGVFCIIKIANTNTSTSCTLNLNSLGTKTIILPGGGAPAIGDIAANMEAQFFYNGTNFILLNAVSASQIQNSAYQYAADTGTLNNLVVTLSPPVSAYTAGLTFRTKVANTNTAASVLNVNGLGNKSIVLPNGAAIEAGDLVAGMMADFSYDGTNLQLKNPALVIKKVVRQIFTSSGTYTPTSGMAFCVIELIGGGGGGAGCAATSGTQCSVGTGGSGGGYCRILTSAGVIGSSQSITIGGGGNGGAAGNAGAPGGSTIVGVSFISATGGGAGQPGSASTSVAVGNAAPNAAGVGSGGDLNEYGEIGRFGICNPANSFAFGGIGGRSKLGSPSATITNNTSGSAAPANSGAGGNGGGASPSNGTGSAGGNGGSGLVIITEFCSQ